MSNNIEMIKSFTFKLSVPKSVNALYGTRFNYKTGRASFYMNRKAKEVKSLLEIEIKVEALRNGCPKFKNKIVIGEIEAFNIRKNRDLNNLHKLLWDSFQSAGIIDNDINVIERSISKYINNTKQQYLLVTIYEAKGVPSLTQINKYFNWLSYSELYEHIKRLVITVSSKRRE